MLSSALAAFAWANLKHDLSALWSWLCHRSFWQLVSMGLAIFALVQHFEIVSARHEAAKWQRQYTLIHTQLDKLRSESKAQQGQVTKVIHDYRTVTKPEVVKQVERVESAPLPGQCRTPDLVMRADI